MTKVVAEISMSLDGFVTGPHASPNAGLRQSVVEGLVDELRIHLSPIVLGGGTALLRDERVLLTQISVRASSTATHLVYRVG